MIFIKSITWIIIVIVLITYLANEVREWLIIIPWL